MNVREIVYSINKKLYYQLHYFKVRKHFANFNNPKNLSEYLLAKMIEPEFIRYAPYADKILVREYVASKGLSHTLPQTYGVWANAEEINFDVLPNKFALKTNHGCGNHIICHKKELLDINNAIKKLNKTLNKTYSITEPHYKHITPRIFAEELIDDGKGELPTDYKFMCVNGEPKCILICSERGENTLPLKCVYSIDWIHLKWVQNDGQNVNIPKPKHLGEMIEIARILSSDFDFVRVDLYDCPDKVVFGELTFSPAEGILSTFTKEALEEMNPLKE